MNCWNKNAGPEVLDQRADERTKDTNTLVARIRQVYSSSSSRNLMRRFTANSIVVALLALLLAPATLLADAQKLCCRRAGMHHCDGGGASSSAPSESSFNSNAAKCPMNCCASTAHAKFAAPKFLAALNYQQAADLLVRKQVPLHADLRSSNLRDRSPPFLS